VDFRYSDEHLELRNSVRRLFAASVAAGRNSERMPASGGELYSRLARELGVVGLGIPEEFGGSGYGIVELALIHREVGRALLAEPLLACSLAAQVLLHSGDPVACARHLPGICQGELIATVAGLSCYDWDEPVGSRAKLRDDGWHLSGSEPWVLVAQDAALFLVFALSDNGLSLFSVDARSDGVSIEAFDGVDPTRRQGRLILDGAAATIIGTVGQAAALRSRSLDIAVVLLAAEQLGLAERCLEMATDYAKQRIQFGRPIGSFQAVKHKLASVLLEVEAATSAVMFASWVADRDPGQLPTVACIAGATCSEAALLAAGENIQVHGGIGVSWEHPAHLYLKRATTDRMLFGDPQRHLECLATILDHDLPATLPTPTTALPT
jgi:alkylation response protein AidB-like acyl-CoA dehydrogenase